MSLFFFLETNKIIKDIQFAPISFFYYNHFLLVVNVTINNVMGGMEFIYHE